MSPAHLLAPLLERAAREPDAPLLTFVDEHGRDAEIRTAATFVDRVARLAATLTRTHGLRPGDRVLLVYPPAMEFNDALAACLYAGLVPAPVYPPDPLRPGQDLARLGRIAEQAGARALLTSRGYRWAVRAGAARALFTRDTPDWPRLPWIVTDGALADAALPGPVPSPDGVAILQFTSGSTSLPKGVRLTTGNVVHQLDYNREVLGGGPDARAVMWVPQYHDLGLISGILGALRGLWHLSFLSPQTFLHAPAVWFETMARVRATHTASPNFGYELAVRKTTPAQRASWDLSALRVVMSAAEPVVPATVDRFFEAFAPTGLRRDAFCPAYGLAEHAVGVTIGGRQRVSVDRALLATAGRAELDGDLELVGCGAPAPDCAVRVVDVATRQVCGDRRVGEIWVRSPSVADGYEGRPDETRATFGATLDGEPGAWLRTGDLGFRHGGELFVTGRQKDLVILRGRNVHPEDVEEVVRGAHPGVRPGGVAAFAQPGDGTEELVVVAELREGETDAEAVADAIRRALGDALRLVAVVAVVPPRSVRKTTSGKVQRAATRDAWLAGALRPLGVARRAPTATGAPAPTVPLPEHLAALPPEERMEALYAVVRALATDHLRLATEGLRPDDHFVDHGVDSLLGMELLTLLEARLGRSLPRTLFAEHPTLRGAATRVLVELGLLDREETTAPPDAPLPGRVAARRPVPAGTRVAVIGGGVSGLVSALELARLGYRDVVVFESEPEVGGKVLTVGFGSGTVELGQLAISDTWRTTLSLARELGVPVEPMPRDDHWWDDEEGFQPGPAMAPGSRWMTNALRAARLPADPPVPAPSLLEGHDAPVRAFLDRHRLGPLPPRVAWGWTFMGYGGVEDEVPAAYLLSYLQVYARTARGALVVGGNQRLWTTLAAHLETAWGVRVRRGTRVERVRPVDGGVELHVAGAVERFDEVIVATPPAATARLLDADDPLQPTLARFAHYAYVVLPFRAKGMPEGTWFHYPRRQRIGELLGFHRAQGDGDGYVAWMYGGPRGDAAEVAALGEKLRAALAEAGAALEELGDAKRWTFFPHCPTGVGPLRDVEARQGERGLWFTGSWLAFETVEHCARHAGHLVRTCFDPSLLEEEAQRAT